MVQLLSKISYNTQRVMNYQNYYIFYKINKNYHTIPMKHRNTNQNKCMDFSSQAQQLSKEYMAEIRKSLDKMEKIILEHQSSLSHSYKSSRINPEIYIKKLQNQKAALGKSIESSPKYMNTIRYDHQFNDKQKKQIHQQNYSQYNHYFSQKPKKRNSPIERKGITWKNNFIKSPKQQKQFLYIQQEKLQLIPQKLPKNQSNSHFISFTKQILQTQKQMLKIKHKNDNQINNCSKQQSQSNVQLQNLIFQPAQMRVINYPYRGVYQHNHEQLSKSPKQKRIFRKPKVNTKNSYQSSSTSRLNKILKRNPDSLIYERKKIFPLKKDISGQVDKSQISNTQKTNEKQLLNEQEQIKIGQGPSQNRESPSQIIKFDDHAKHPQNSKYRYPILQNNIINQDSIAMQNNEISFHPHSFFKKGNKFIKSDSEIKKQRIRQTKPIIKSKDKDPNKPILLKKIKQKPDDLKIRLEKHYENLHGSLSPKSKNVNKRLFTIASNISRSKSPSPTFTKYQKVSQKDKFKKQVKKEYNFIEKYLSDDEINDIYDRLHKSSIPESNWLKQVYHEAKQKNNY